jgi:uncharacterized membrane protein HdeD (DUF308 family)
MIIELAKSWWSLVIRGVVAILMALLTFAWPGITLTALVFLFGAYALIDGVVNITGAVRASKAHEKWGILVLEGIAGIVAAAVTILWPAITAVALVYVIAAWAVVSGTFELVAAVRLRKYIAGEWILALSGIASILFGVLIMAAPLAGALVIALWVGVYLLIFGALLVGLGFRLRSLAHPRATGPAFAGPLR